MEVLKMSVLNYADKEAEDRIIYALTMEDVFDVAEEKDISRETVEENIESIYEEIMNTLEYNWRAGIENALDNIR
jgi:chromosome condensin MukBEF complex kleisin-like MukF subunit